MYYPCDIFIRRQEQLRVEALWSIYGGSLPFYGGFVADPAWPVSYPKMLLIIKRRAM